MTICPDTTIRQSASCLTAKVGEEIVVMSVDRGLYYAFDPIGSDIWNRIAQPCTVKSLSQSLLADYEATPEAIKADVLSLLKDLSEANLIDIDG